MGRWRVSPTASSELSRQGKVIFKATSECGRYLAFNPTKGPSPATRNLAPQSWRGNSDVGSSLQSMTGGTGKTKGAGLTLMEPLLLVRSSHAFHFLIVPAVAQ